MPRERYFEVSKLVLAGQEWGQVGGIPLLAIHGWLDNAGSFDLLAPKLNGYHTIALDAPGHGNSMFRSPDSSYNIWQDIGDLIEVADQLGWQTFRVLGHSRGAAIAMLLAGTFPERVEQLVLVEGGIPTAGRADEVPTSLARAINEKRACLQRTARVFVDRDSAIAARAAGFTRVTYGAAEILARRSLRKVEGGFSWRVDQRLKARSDLRLTAEEVQAFVEHVAAPVLFITGRQSSVTNIPLYDEMASEFRNIEIVRLPGGHHLHLEGAEAEIAKHMARFFGAH